jgi:hypothetical protein
MKPKLNIIIVNWNSGSQLRDCIASISTADKSNFFLNNVIIVDNASTDGSANSLNTLEVPLKLIFNDKNLGFSKGCNQGALYSQADYLLFLNPDTRLFFNSLTKPIHFMEENKNKHVGICGVRLVDEIGNYTTSFASFPNIIHFLTSALGLDKLPHRINQRHLQNNDEFCNGGTVDQIIGAFFMVRKKLYDKLNGFDERFFVYYEEVDFSLRAKLLGYSSYYLNNVTAFHRCGGCSDSVKSERLFYSMRSRLQYGYKHFTIYQQLTLIFITFFLELFTRIIGSIAGRSNSDIRETIIGFSKLFNYVFFSRFNNENI